jgi:hypothetical protein
LRAQRKSRPRERARTAMRRDRTGEPVDDDQDDNEHRCSRGWLDRDGVQPRPRPVCRPWLAEVPARKPRPDELEALRARWAALVATSRPT